MGRALPLSPQMLRRLLRYDGDTGNLYWLPRPASMFAPHNITGKKSTSADIWNKQNAGRLAFISNHKGGYLMGAIFNKHILAHRVIVAMHTGKWPDQVDHINGKRWDNRLVNLRAVTQSENCKNAKVRSDNSSGVTGVRWAARERRWKAEITVNGRNKYIGVFASFEDAVAARKSAEQAHGFHQNHGRGA